LNRENLVNYFELLFKFALWSSLIGVFLFITDFGFIKSEAYELNLYGEAMIIVKAIFENKKRFAL
jgi:hypothetical protein